MSAGAAPALRDIEALSNARLYWDDLPVGTCFDTPARSITEADVVGFASLTGDFNRLHVDCEFARNSVFGQRLAHGMLVASVGIGLATRTLVHQLIENTAVSVVENRLQFLKPTFIGDTIHLRIEVIEARPTRKPERGMTIFRRSIINQRNETVIESTVTYLMNRRPDGHGGTA
ncbi:MaoC/PaaZ C-terminal domain-containing protein [Variovorax sp. KK3]|uniref:MaoC/PaaZ C-terminal domain-containing protein n=1 Tax=Variovorax sp. KK3 TaxID=1855728 RepID=UPI00097BDBF9|nr:MaoC/PaaZ C-terminal domain-containing protein [Variovorax sp. KK3]